MRILHVLHAMELLMNEVNVSYLITITFETHGLSLCFICVWHMKEMYSTCVYSIHTWDQRLSKNMIWNAWYSVWLHTSYAKFHIKKHENLYKNFHMWKITYVKTEESTFGIQHIWSFTLDFSCKVFSHITCSILIDNLIPYIISILKYINTRRTDRVIFDPWDTLAVHIFGTVCNNILKI